MELFYGYGLTVLETVFILTGLLILHIEQKSACTHKLGENNKHSHGKI